DAVFLMEKEHHPRDAPVRTDPYQQYIKKVIRLKFRALIWRLFPSYQSIVERLAPSRNIFHCYELIMTYYVAQSTHRAAEKLYLCAYNLHHLKNSLPLLSLLLTHLKLLLGVK